VELVQGPGGRDCRGGLTMAAPSYVHPIARVAGMLGEGEDLLADLALNLETEDGCLWVLDIDNGSTLAFTADGIDSLRQLLPDLKR
jgi:hypothetical protein